MKTAKYYSLLVCAALTFLINTVQSETNEYIKETVAEFSLRGIKEVVPYVNIYWSAEQSTSKLADEIEVRAAEILTESGIKVGSSEPNDAVLSQLGNSRLSAGGKIRLRSVEIPELMIRIYAIKHELTQSYVFNVQTSLARKVYTTQSIRSAAKAEVWRIDVNPSAVDANNFEVMLNAAVEGQVKRFIEEYKKANSGRAVIDDSDNRRQGKPASSLENTKTNEESSQLSQNQYLSSKNSPVFHKADCSSVERISSENLITYKSREEAIQSGKRPCKMCAP